jgi:hypothetical protein
MAAHPVRVGHVNRGTQVTVERLHLRKFKGIVCRYESGLRKSLGHEDEKRRRLSQNSIVGNKYSGLRWSFADKLRRTVE